MPPAVAVDTVRNGVPQGDIVAGSVVALRRDMDLRVLLVGPRTALQDLLTEVGETGDLVAEFGDRLHLLDAPTAILPDEDAAIVVRARAGASIRVAAQAVLDGHADRLVTAGPLAAAVAVAEFSLGRAPGMRRPIAAAVLERLHGPLVVLDVGAQRGATSALLAAGAAAALDLDVLRAIRADRAVRVGVLAPLGAPTPAEAELVALVALVAHAHLPGDVIDVGVLTVAQVLAGAADLVVTSATLGRTVVETFAAGVGRVLHLLGAKHPATVLEGPVTASQIAASFACVARDRLAA